MLKRQDLVPFRDHTEEYRCRLLGLTYTPTESTSSLSSGSASLGSMSSSVVQKETEEWFEDTCLEKLNLDASQWRHQDHYAVLGLGRLRHLATPEHIKLAYRRRILSYHPDKSGKTESRQKILASGESMADNLFKCVQRSWETLSDSQKRQQVDSVDPTFNEAIPKENAAGNFFTLYAPVFERNARFSIKQPVPLLGDTNSGRAEVEAFYDFWRKIESWRRFEWLDDDETAGTDAAGETRADKRWTEKKNKAARQKRKAEDNTRLNKLVEQAYKADPRIQAFKVADKEAKDAKLREKETEKQAREQEAQREQRDQEQAKLAIEQAAKEAAAVAKANKEAIKTVLKKEKKAFREYWTQANYHIEDKDLKALEQRSSRVEALCQTLDHLQLAELNGKLSKKPSPETAVSLLFSSIEASEPSVPQPTPKQQTPEPKKEVKPWSSDEIDALIKAVKQFPPGTTDRWAKIAAHMGKHGASYEVEDVIREAASLRDTTGSTVPTPTTSTVPPKRDPRIAAFTPTVRSDENRPWSAEEQSALERALKAVSQDAPDRWDQITNLVNTRTKKECMSRVRDIALALKQKRRS